MKSSAIRGAATYAAKELEVLHKMARRTNSKPYDDKGRFVPLSCRDPECDGVLRSTGLWAGWWECDGLIDPGVTHRALQPCLRSHQDGEATP